MSNVCGQLADESVEKKNDNTLISSKRTKNWKYVSNFLQLFLYMYKSKNNLCIPENSFEILDITQYYTCLEIIYKATWEICKYFSLCPNGLMKTMVYYSLYASNILTTRI